jgi:uracil-DNA glycosylase family 4
MSTRTTLSPSFKALQKNIITCNECPRLRTYCQKIAQVKRKAYQDETYWGRPITGFGDPLARLMIVGLAPAAHGANRTGRIFTGDRSGEWLYRALHQYGFANQPHSLHAEDGLTLTDAYISCVVKCAPPDNKPSPIEQERCGRHLKQELEALKNVKVWIALGQIAFQGIWPWIHSDQKKPKFGHGQKVQLGPDRWLLLSYHPSQQNTFTGKLTQPMFHSVFQEARELLG